MISLAQLTKSDCRGAPTTKFCNLIKPYMVEKFHGIPQEDQGATKCLTGLLGHPCSIVSERQGVISLLHILPTSEDGALLLQHLNEYE